jgi:co-chaperonin GroES (HSP10)
MALTKEQYIEKHFPTVDPGAKPTGNQVMIQLRTVAKQSKGGIVLVEETKDFNKGNTQVARVVRLGTIAFHDRTSGEEWKEGAWVGVGDIILAPRYGGFRFEVPVPDTDDEAIFAIINDYDIKMVIEGNFEAFDKIL